MDPRQSHQTNQNFDPRNIFWAHAQILLTNTTHPNFRPTSKFYGPTPPTPKFRFMPFFLLTSPTHPRHKRHQRYI